METRLDGMTSSCLRVTNLCMKLTFVGSRLFGGDGLIGEILGFQVGHSFACGKDNLDGSAGFHTEPSPEVPSQSTSALESFI